MRRRHHPTVSRIDLVKLFKSALAQNFKEKLVWKFSVLIFRGQNPLVDDNSFDPANGLFLWNAGIGHAIEMAAEKLFFLLGTELAIIGQALVFCARDKIEKVFFQIRAGAGDGVNFVLTNHLGQRNAELGGAHRAGESDHHFAATAKVRDVSIGGIFDHRGVEVPVMPINEFADRTRLYAVNARGFTCPLSLHGKIYNAIFNK